MLVSIRFAWKEMCILSDQAKPRSSETFAKVVTVRLHTAKSSGPRTRTIGKERLK